MKGDFSRLQFDPTKHYRGVLHQQGRVWLDSDWNEDVTERLALLERELRDLVGPFGVPSSAAFQISASTDANPDNFRIAGGNGYVDGLVSEIEGGTSYLSQVDYPDAPRIKVPTDGTTLTVLIHLEVWYRLVTCLQDNSIREVALGGPDTSARLKSITQVKVVSIPNGTVKCADASQLLPQAGSGQLTTLQPAINPALTACQLPDPANFTGRENRLYRVEVHDAGDVDGIASGFSFFDSLAADAPAGATSVTLGMALTSDQASAATRTGFVTVAASNGVSERLPLTGINPALTVLTLGQPLANAYTVANRAGVSGGLARFKWSSDNASFAAAVTNVKADRISITLASLGRDMASAFRQGDLVELCDDASDLGPARGHLTFLTSDPDPDMLTVQLADPLPPTFQLSGEVSSRHLLIRRWDGVGDASAQFDAAATPGMNLGNGVHIQFSGSDLRAGDYWQFAVRAADGSVQALTNAAQHGIKRHRAALGIYRWGPAPPTVPPSVPPSVAMSLVQDCRRVFPALVDFPQPEKGFHVNGVSVVDPSNLSLALMNDTDVHVDAFNGLDVQCDAPPDPASVSRPSCFITVEFPVVSNSPGALWYYPVSLAGTVSVDTSKMLISWRVLPQSQSLLTDMINSSPNERGILARITLKGRWIWALNNPTVFLDGEAFGQRLTATNNTSLQLPSGDNRRAGDFEMWFWIVAALSFAKQITVTPTQIHAGEQAVFTVTLSSGAPAGATATITNSTPAVASILLTPPVAPGPTATVPVPQGVTSFNFTFVGNSTGSTAVTVAFGTPPVSQTTTLTVLAAPLLSGMQIAPPSIQIGLSALATVTLSAPSPLSGTVVTLASLNATVARPDAATITIPSGATSGNFSISGLAIGNATITANTGSSSVSATINVHKKLGKETKEAKEVENKGIRNIEVFQQVTRLDKPVIRNLGKLADSTTRIFVSGAPASSGTARSFIQPQERPDVEARVLEDSLPEPIH